MAYKHGVYTSEIATSISPAVNSQGCLPVVFGTAPVHLATKPAKANTPVLCYSYKEAVEQLGYSDDWEKYTLCEVMYTQFALYQRAPIVFVNVVNPEKHKESVQNAQQDVTNKQAVINDAVLVPTLKVASDSAGKTLLVKDTDYVAAYNDRNELVISLLQSGTHYNDSQLYVTYDKVVTTSITKKDIIGGIDVATGAYTGLEVLALVFTKTGMVPGMIAAPGWSHDPAVAAVMTAKVSNINGLFQAVAFTDIPTDTVTKYTDVANWKNTNNYTSAYQAVCWPMVSLGGKKYYMSSHMIGVCSTVDSNNGDIPYVSPSNQPIKIDSIVLKNGKEVDLPLDSANYLNSQGVLTALNFIGGWKLWGNRMACYPANTDPKDSFICVRRMFNWQAQTFILTYFSRVDNPIRKRLLTTIADSENIRLNGLVAAGVLLSGKIEFRADENPVTDLMDGIIKFHTEFAPPTPARVIHNTLEFDVQALKKLFV